MVRVEVGDIRHRGRPRGALEALLDLQEELNLGVAVALVARVALAGAQGDWLCNIG